MEQPEYDATRSSSGVVNARATATAARFARLGLWLIPVYGVLLALSTLTHQPDSTRTSRATRITSPPTGFWRVTFEQASREPRSDCSASSRRSLSS
jgi:hypothetical protein